ncbi:hypothetical protein [Occultella gossypii]|uniref:Uncharacterized protein n=1 Tax=Occultella gossypii TaxID=2800820 RepID=A0ABS7SAQ3_9MICO|nr:hypothetical protein [Occultella gossypii]MBZ2197270.1 hypothetical protein [Occultella gossypii]
MKVRIKVRPTGSVNGHPWPAVGEVIDLADVSALGMIEAGQVEVVTERAAKVETRPAKDTAAAETRIRTRRRKV